MGQPTKKLRAGRHRRRRRLDARLGRLCCRVISGVAASPARLEETRLLVPGTNDTVCDRTSCYSRSGWPISSVG